MIVPHNVYAEGIAAHCLDELQSMLPIFDWNARIVHFSSHQLFRKGQASPLIHCQGRSLFNVFDNKKTCDGSESNDKQDEMIPVHILQIMQIKYQNNRDIQQGNNFLANLRPSAIPRIIRFPLEYCVFQTALTYGIFYNGFGIHSYYMQKTGTVMNYGPWARVKTLGFTFGKYFAVALPFFYLKQVFLSLTFISTREKPALRKLLDFAYIQNIFAMVTTFPIFYYFQRNLTKSLRGSLVLGLFAMVNDLFIQKRRQHLILKSYDPEELKRKQIHKNANTIKSFMQFTVNNKKAKQTIRNYNWTRLEERVIMEQQQGKDVQALRKKQLQALSKVIRDDFLSFSKKFEL